MTRRFACHCCQGRACMKRADYPDMEVSPVSRKDGVLSSEYLGAWDINININIFIVVNIIIYPMVWINP